MFKSALDVQTVSEVELEKGKSDEENIAELLRLAGIDPKDAQAAAALRFCYQSACASAHPKATFRPSQNDHNAPLDRVKDAAQELINALNSLENAHHHANSAFWLNKAWASPLFQPRPDLSDNTGPKEMRSMTETRDDARYGARIFMQRLIISAENAKIDSKGGRPKGTTKRIIKDAFDFYVRQASEKPSSTPTGNFANFARTFFIYVTGNVEQSEKLGRAIRDVVAENREKVGRRSA